jgi:xanthine/uracil permease
MPEERLPWGQTIVSGMQHGVAMAGGTAIAPIKTLGQSSGMKWVEQGRLPLAADNR